MFFRSLPDYQLLDSQASRPSKQPAAKFVFAMDSDPALIAMAPYATSTLDPIPSFKLRPKQIPRHTFATYVTEPGLHPDAWAVA